MKEIGRCYKYIVKAIDGLNTQMMEQMITPEKLTNRFCGNLGLANLEFLKLATAVIATFRSLRITEGHTSEKQPASVAAAAIYLCVQIWRGEAAAGIDVKRISVSLVSFVHHASHLPRHLPAVIYLYRRKPVSNSQEISGMAEATILTSYGDMYPYAAKMLPEAYVERIPELEVSFFSSSLFPYLRGKCFFITHRFFGRRRYDARVLFTGAQDGQGRRRGVGGGTRGAHRRRGGRRRRGALVAAAVRGFVTGRRRERRWDDAQRERERDGGRARRGVGGLGGCERFVIDFAFVHPSLSLERQLDPDLMQGGMAGRSSIIVAFPPTSLAPYGPMINQ